MKKLEQHIEGSARKIRLRASEKRALRERVVSYMEYHQLPLSVRTQGVRRVEKKEIQKEVIPYTQDFSYIRFSFRSWQVRTLIGAFGIVLFVGVPMAAERSVPGEVLYAVKVHINEEAYGTLSLSSFEKVAWETRRVERRIAEARLLAREGKLTDEVEAQIVETVRAHAESAHKELAEMRENNVEEAAVAQVVLESALDVQTAVLATEHSATTEGEEQIKDLASTVRDAKETVRVGVPEELVLSSYERFSAEIEAGTTRAQELFLSLESSISETEKMEIERRLTDLKRRVADAHIHNETGRKEGALLILTEALSDTQKLISFLTDIDVRLSVALETLVPKVPTLEERNFALELLRRQLVSGVTTLEARLLLLEDEAVKEKVALGLIEAQKDLETIHVEGYTDVELLTGAENAGVRAKVMVDDLLALTGGGVTEVLPPTLQDVTEASTTPATTTEPVATPEEVVGDVEVSTSTTAS